MIQLSPSAVEEIHRLRKRHTNPNAIFRLAIQSGGCSGLLYITKFDDAVQSSDRIYESNGIQVAIDPQSADYFKNGLSLDFSEDLMGGSFRFHNPNAKKSCGCGVSFSIDES
jgi:iron-sulfur cluster assembly accessory protein